MAYNLVIIFMIEKYFWDGSVDIGKRCRTMLCSCVCYYFSYGVIFIVFSRSFVGVSNFCLWERWLPNSGIKAMIESTQRFEIPLFDGKINFMIWQSTIQYILMQLGLDQTLEDERLVSINETEIEELFCEFWDLSVLWATLMVP